MNNLVNHSTLNTMSNLTLTRRIKSLITSFMVFIGLFAFSIDGAAQSYPIASINSQGIIQLPLNQPLSENYLFDLNGVNTEDQVQLINFLSSKNNANFTFRYKPSENKGILILSLKANPSRTTTDWNSLLMSHCSQNPIKQ